MKVEANPAIPYGALGPSDTAPMQIDCGVAECDAAGNLITPTHHGVWMLAAVAAIVFVLPNFRRGTR